MQGSDSGSNNNLEPQSEENKKLFFLQSKNRKWFVFTCDGELRRPPDQKVPKL